MFKLLCIYTRYIFSLVLWQIYLVLYFFTASMAHTVSSSSYKCTECPKCKKKDYELSGHFTNDCFGPDSTRSCFWSIGRIFAKIVRNLRALPYTFGGKIWRDSQSSEGPVPNMFKNSSRSLFRGDSGRQSGR